MKTKMKQDSFRQRHPTCNVGEPNCFPDVFSGLRRLRSLWVKCPDHAKGEARRNRISVKSVKSVVHSVFMKHEEPGKSPVWRWRCSSTSRNQNWHGSVWCAGNRSKGQEKDHGFHGFHG